MRSILHVALVTLLGVASPAFAQFQLHSWENFEQGKLPDKSILLQDATTGNVRVVEYGQLGDAAMRQGAGKTECGRYGLELRTAEKSRYLCMVAPITLIRAKLGERGRALFQADIYIKGAADLGHTVSIMAVGVDGLPAPLAQGQKHWTLYRFGCLANNKAFLSYTRGSAQPQIYLHDKLENIEPRREGWHRFQLLVEGQKSISCFVDGMPTGFSPVQEGTLTVLQPGVMVTAPADKPLVAYIDNLSIQWSMDPSNELPRSPWLEGLDASAVQAGKPRWIRDGGEAQLLSRQQNKAMMLLFYTPGSLAFQELSNNIFQNSEDAQRYLGQTVPVLVDVNQLGGGYLSQQYKITRVPTLVIVDPSGTEKGRLTILKDERWKTIQPKLKALLPAAN